MFLRKTALGLVSAGLILGSTSAIAAPVDARDAAPVFEGENAGFQGLGWLIALIVAAGVVAVVVADDDEDEPVSP